VFLLNFAVVFLQIAAQYRGVEEHDFLIKSWHCLMKWKAWWGSLEWDGVGVGWIIWVVSSNGWPLVCLDDVKLSPNIIQEQLRQLRENLVIFIFTAGHAANFLLAATTTATCESETLKKASNVFIMLAKAKAVAKPISQPLAETVRKIENCSGRRSRSCNMACHQILLLFK